MANLVNGLLKRHLEGLLVRIEGFCFEKGNHLIYAV